MCDDNDCFINIKTVQTGAFRVLVESLKEILTDTNFVFDKDGIKLIATDNSHIVLIHMKLHADKFEHYYCKQKISVGINMMNMFKLIKTMGNNDILTIFIDKNIPNKMGLKINNVDKNTQTTFMMNLLDITDEEISIPPATFETELTLPSTDFQKIIRDMTNIGERIEIKSIGNTLKLNCTGDFADQETILYETQGGLNFSTSQPPDLPIQGVFSLKSYAFY